MAKTFSYLLNVLFLGYFNIVQATDLCRFCSMLMEVCCVVGIDSVSLSVYVHGHVQSFINFTGFCRLSLEVLLDEDEQGILR